MDRDKRTGIQRTFSTLRGGGEIGRAQNKSRQQVTRAACSGSGENGIRTRDARFQAYRFSKPALSATQPSLHATQDTK